MRWGIPVSDMVSLGTLSFSICFCSPVKCTFQDLRPPRFFDFSTGRQWIFGVGMNDSLELVRNWNVLGVGVRTSWTPPVRLWSWRSLHWSWSVRCVIVKWKNVFFFSVLYFPLILSKTKTDQRNIDPGQIYTFLFPWGIAERKESEHKKKRKTRKKWHEIVVN